MKLTLHVGMGKTGTSAIQRFLNQEKLDLAEAGIFNTGNRFQNLKSNFLFKKQGEITNTNLLKEGLQALSDTAKNLHNISHIVWSNESLSMSRNYENLIEEISRSILEAGVFDEVTVILAFRRQDDWLESAYRQWGLKHKTHAGRRILSIEEYTKSIEPYLDYLSIYRAWSNLGTTPVIVADFGDIVQHGGMVRFMADYLSLPWKESYSQYDQVHSSLGPALSFLNATYNSGFRGKVLPDEFKGIIQDLSLPEISPAKSGFLSRELREGILNRYRADNETLSIAAFGSRSLFQSVVTKETSLYRRGWKDVSRYLTMIAQRQQKEINNLNSELRKEKDRIARIEKILKIEP